MARPGPRVLTVTELARRIRDTLERDVGVVWVAGELSNVRRVASGHVYFTLKDDDSQLAAALFRRVASVLPFEPRDGTMVVVAARPSLYEARGALQLYVDAMEPLGLGALRLAFEQLKERLAAEGLFALERKRPLPRYPSAVGIVTAAEGAAVHDIRTVIRRRWPSARVILRPVRVQGTDAWRDVVAGIEDLNRLSFVDVLIVGRGGGSLEDLWAFNEEGVARAIVGSRIPVVSAVGHESDVTIADFVADVRAPTPTAAAALVVPDRIEVAAAVARARAALRSALGQRVSHARRHLVSLERGLGAPRRRTIELAQRLDELGLRSRRALGRRALWERRRLEELARRLDAVGPRARLGHGRARLDGARHRLRFALDVRLRDRRAALARIGGRLDALSPLACLERGYAIVRHGGPDGPVVRDAGTLQPGDRIAMVFARGRATGRVERTDG
jgi:exodeoxyribonuclease VII large subunit